MVTKQYGMNDMFWSVMLMPRDPSSLCEERLTHFSSLKHNISCSCYIKRRNLHFRHDVLMDGFLRQLQIVL